MREVLSSKWDETGYSLSYKEKQKGGHLVFSLHCLLACYFIRIADPFSIKELFICTLTWTLDKTGELSMRVMLEGVMQFPKLLHES